MKLGVLGVSLGLVVACSSFDTVGGSASAGGGDGGTLPDGGPAPVTGTYAGQVGVTVTAEPVRRGRTAKVGFTITRGYNYAAAVAVHLEGLPSTITSEGVTVDGSATTGELTLTIGHDTPIGPLKGPKLVATGLTADSPTQSVSYEPEVRGAPGDVDLTFGTGGVLTVGDSAHGSELDVDAQGRIVVLTDTMVRRFDAEGHGEDGTFKKQIFKSGRSLFVTHRGSSIFLGRNKPQTDADVASPYEAGGKIIKLNADGTFDLGYGSSGIASAGVDDVTAASIGDDIRALAFQPSYADGTPTQYDFTPSGTSTRYESSKITKSAWIRGIVFLPDGSAVVAGNGVVAKLLSDNVTLDTNFGAGGYRTVDSTLHINDLIRDQDGRFLVTGHLDSGHLYLARLDSSGNVDGTFHSQTSAETVRTETISFDQQLPLSTTTNARPFAGRLAVGPEKSIYQVAQTTTDGASHCVVKRFLADGTPDPDFGDAGSVTLPPSGCYAHRIVSQSDTFVLVGGPTIVRVWQ